MPSGRFLFLLTQSHAANRPHTTFLIDLERLGQNVERGIQCDVVNRDQSKRIVH